MRNTLKGVVMFKAAASMSLGPAWPLEEASAAPAAPATLYRPPDLCISPTLTPYLEPTFSVKIAKVHAQDDHVENANGVSMRSCSWKATTNTNGIERYKCDSKTGGHGWLSHAYENVVIRRSNAGPGVFGQVETPELTCNGQYRTQQMPAVTSDQSMYDHIHIRHKIQSQYGQQCHDGQCTFSTPPSGGQPNTTSAGVLNNYVFNHT